MTNTEGVVRKLVENIVLTEKLENYTINIKPISTDGANYTSVLYKVNITSKGREDINLFSKVALMTNSYREEFTNFDVIYEIEHKFYTDVVPKFQQLQNKYILQLEERFRTPKYYGSSAKYMEESLLLEDLVANGYILHDRFLPLDQEYTFKATEELAKFHALSFAFKYQHPESYNTFVNRYESKTLQFFITMKNFFIDIASSVYGVIPDNTIKERLKKYVDRQLEVDMIHKYYGSGNIKVLVHGDYRASNIMYKKENTKFSSMVPVDYQTVRLGSPSTDLLYLIYTGTDEYFRRAHLTQLLDLYYDTLSSWLRRMDLDPDLLFSRRDFDQDYQDMLPYGLNMAIFTLPVVLVDPKQAPSLSSEGSEFVVQVGDTYKNRFLPILDEYVKMGTV